MSLVGTVETSEGPLAELCEFVTLYFVVLLCMSIQYKYYCCFKEVLDL